MFRNMLKCLNLCPVLYHGDYKSSLMTFQVKHGLVCVTLMVVLVVVLVFIYSN